MTVLPKDGGTSMFNLGAVNEAIAAAFPDKEAIVFRDRRLTFGQLNDRTRRLANYLVSRGLGVRTPRSALKPWESGQDQLALYLFNGNEYLEGMIGAYKARVAPFNVNYRYVEEELVYLLNNARSRAIIYHSNFAPRVAAVRASVPSLEVFIQVADDSGNALLPGAVDYETVLRQSSPDLPKTEPSPDDLYILYTGGTTGMPKGVLWRQADILVAALAGRAADGTILQTLDAYVQRAKNVSMKMFPAAPYMHGAGHWIALTALHQGNTVFIQSDVERLDPADILSLIDREKINFLQIVGDAFARPIVDAIRNGEYDLSSLGVILSGGAPLNASIKAEILELVPHVMIIDGLGSSEAGGQGSQISNKATGASTGKFVPGPDNVVVDEALTKVLAPGHDGMGWWAKRGFVPLGYLDDAAKTERTFVMIDGTRFSVPGDRARHLADGTIELHGRDSVTINSGGEKIFAEEVEHALKHHPAVYDAVVAGRPSERWGQEVVAVVQLRSGARVTDAELSAECAKHIARYKLPKAYVFRDAIVRSPSGKADYRWAKEQATGSSRT
jgi:acyl-CoA synthetase (AMP-forming)/AMP-acid ligase II